jgi:hypothetical protein
MDHHITLCIIYTLQSITGSTLQVVIDLEEAIERQGQKTTQCWISTRQQRRCTRHTQRESKSKKKERGFSLFHHLIKAPYTSIPCCFFFFSSAVFTHYRILCRKALSKERYLLLCFVAQSPTSFPSLLICCKTISLPQLYHHLLHSSHTTKGELKWK